MSDQASLVQEGVERFNEAWRSAGEEVQRLQKQLQHRRHSLEKQITARRKRIEKQTRRRVSRARTELERNPWVKRAQSLRDEAWKRLERGLDGTLGNLRIASRRDVERIERRITQLNRRIKEIEQARRSNGKGPAGADPTARTS